MDRCSFCGKSVKQVRQLIAGAGGVFICDECVELCMDILTVDEDSSAGKGAVSEEGLARETLELLAGEQVRAVTLPAGASGPACRHCGHSLEGAADGRVVEAEHQDQPGSLQVLLLYCTSCGAPFHAAIVSEGG